MKNKILCLLFILIIPFLLMGCKNSFSCETNLTDEFVAIEKIQTMGISGKNIDMYIVVNKNTKIMYYFVVDDFYGDINIETIFNPDGTPKIYYKEL